MFDKFIERKESEKFNHDLIKAVEDCGQLMQMGLDKDEQIFKVVINPDAEKTICFVTGEGNGKGGPHGILEFLKTKLYIPERKKVVILPLINPISFNESLRNEDDIWRALKDENLVLLCTLRESPESQSWSCNQVHLTELATDLKNLAEKYFSISRDKPDTNSLEKRIYEEKAVPYLITEMPGKAPLKKQTDYTKNAMKLIINSI